MIVSWRKCVCGHTEDMHNMLDKQLETFTPRGHEIQSGVFGSAFTKKVELHKDFGWGCDFKDHTGYCDCISFKEAKK